jgi:hypothetical protein
MKLTRAELFRIRQRHRGYRITLLVQVAILLLLPLTQRLLGLLSFLLCLLAAVLLVFTSRFSPLRSSKRLIFGLGGLAIAMELLWHGTLILAPSLGRWLTLTREPIVTTSVVLGAASGYFTLGIAGGILLTALWVLDPSSFNAAVLPSVSAGQPPVLAMAPALMVSAFGVLTAVGSSVLNPASVGAQVVATSVAITGQLYVAILIGLILGWAQRRL